MGCTTSSKAHNLLMACDAMQSGISVFLGRLSLQPWRKHHLPKSQWTATWLHGVISPEILFFKVMALRKSDPLFYGSLTTLLSQITYNVGIISEYGTEKDVGRSRRGFNEIFLYSPAGNAEETARNSYRSTDLSTTNHIKSPGNELQPPRWRPNKNSTGWLFVVQYTAMPMR